jgi:hypothetical protein
VTPWSFSSIKTFEQCPKKYYHLKVAQDVKDQPGEAALYGSVVHKAAEDRVKDGVEIPKKFGYMRPIVDRLLAIEGEKYAEVEMGVIRGENDEFMPCDFSDPAAYYRGIADLLIINDDVAWCIDYKTGKSSRYADLRQLDLMAGAVFVHHPQVRIIKSALLFVVANDIVKKEHLVENKVKYLTTFDRQVSQLEQAFSDDVWNPKTGPLCGWCPVKDCAHSRG